MTRVAPVSPDDMTDAQRQVAAEIASGPRGVVRGPVQMWLHSPAFARLAQGLGAYCRFGTVLPPHLTELAILVTGAHWRSGYEWLGHAPLALEAGVSAEAIEAIRTGKHPVLATDEAAVEALAGKQGLVDLIGILGYYGMISMTINAFRIEGAPGTVDPFL